MYYSFYLCLLLTFLDVLFIMEILGHGISWVVERNLLKAIVLSKGGISHFFADDLVLFKEASCD